MQFKVSLELVKINLMEHMSKIRGKLESNETLYFQFARILSRIQDSSSLP
jgi:hypothetical protein